MIPLVSKVSYETYKGSVSPGINDKVLSMIRMHHDILILNQAEDRGYILTSDEFKECEQLRDTWLCNPKGTQENLKYSEFCITELIYKNSSENCEKKLLKTDKVIWMATIKPNVWRYLAPTQTKLNITHGKNVTSLDILGTGIIQVEMGMEIHTEQTTISYFDSEYVEAELLVYQPDFNVSGYKKGHPEYNRIPNFNDQNLKDSFIDNKSLYDMGINVKELLNQRTVLQNLLYAPLENPWFTTTTIAVIGGVIGIFFCCFKGEISCCAKKMEFNPIGMLDRRENRINENNDRKIEENDTKKSEIEQTDEKTQKGYRKDKKENDKAENIDSHDKMEYDIMSIEEYNKEKGNNLLGERMPTVTTNTEKEAAKKQRQKPKKGRYGTVY